MSKTIFPLMMALAWAAPAARAAEVTQTQVMLSADNCQAALPAFDGNIRKRPMAMQNEGASAAFVTCAFKGLRLDAHSVGNNLIGIALGSTGSQPVSVTCTLVDGVVNPIYVTRTRTVTPGVANLLFWQPADFGLSGSGLNQSAMSCGLTPGTNVMYTLRSYIEYIAD